MQVREGGEWHPAARSCWEDNTLGARHVVLRLRFKSSIDSDVSSPGSSSAGSSPVNSAPNSPTGNPCLRSAQALAGPSKCEEAVGERCLDVSTAGDKKAVERFMRMDEYAVKLNELLRRFLQREQADRGCITWNEEKQFISTLRQYRTCAESPTELANAGEWQKQLDDAQERRRVALELSSSADRKPRRRRMTKKALLRAKRRELLRTQEEKPHLKEIVMEIILRGLYWLAHHVSSRQLDENSNRVDWIVFAMECVCLQVCLLSIVQIVLSLLS